MFFYQLKNELWKLFGKKRTYIGFAMFLLAQLAILLILRYHPAAHRALLRSYERNGYGTETYLSMLSIATVILAILAISLLPLYTALVGGDLVSKEAEDGTLRMILSRPVSRLRLLCLKWLAGAVFSFVLILALGAFSLFFCSLWFPVHGGMFTLLPDQGVQVFGFGDGLRHYLLALACLVAKTVTVLSFAFMFSCFNMKPAAATILALSLIIIDHFLMTFELFHDFRDVFLGYHLNAWMFMFNEHVPWWRIGESLSVLSGFSLTCLIIGFTVFQVRDIKS